MKKTAIILLLCLTFLSHRSFALNLTPHRLLVSGDGPPRARYFFQDGNKRLGFHIDGKMSATGSSDMAIFRFEGFNSASVRLYKSPSQVSVPFTQTGPGSYEAIARTLLPSEATKVELAETKPDAIPINGWSSLQFVFTYEFYGLTFRRTITFLNFNPTDQFVFQVSAREENYAAIYSRGYHFLNSLFELPLDSKPGPN